MSSLTGDKQEDEHLLKCVIPRMMKVSFKQTSLQTVLVIRSRTVIDLSDPEIKLQQDDLQDYHMPLPKRPNPIHANQS